ncbi:MAG: GH32 C-terminal domain-containing protein, partial [bacterium]|nr:GH32 C-terminal domain-containing protein [bacterium]
YSGMEHDLISCRSCYVRPQDGAIKLRIVMDKMTVEVFVNDGEQVMSNLIYTDSKADGIYFGSKGSLSFEITFHELTKKG